MKKLLPLLLVFVLLAGCGPAPSAPTTGATTPPSADTSAITRPTLPEEQDTAFDREDSVSIVLQGDTATASSDSVRVEGGIITITEEATYVISGTLTEGMLVVDAPEEAKPRLVLENAHITSSVSAALYVRQGDKVYLTLAADTENSLTGAETFVAVDDNNIDGALFSKQDLTINGTGSLTLTCPGGHGLVCKDDLTMTEGNLTITAASHGLDVNDSVTVTGGSLTVNAGKDGIHCEHDEDATLGWVWLAGGNLKLESQGDGISAGAYLLAEGGQVEILAGGGSVNGTKSSSGFYGGFGGPGGRGGGWGGPGGEVSGSTTEEESGTSMKGMKSEGELRISGGSFTMDTADDSLHSNTSVTISGGSFHISSGDDGVHGEELLTITQCQMVIAESYEGLEALEIRISGGTITIHATDDGINAAGGTDSSGQGGRDGMFGGGPGGGWGGSSDGIIDISGGELVIYASGDGLDANGTLTISGGMIQVANPTAGDTSIMDADYTPVITGGTFLGSGSTTMMAQTFSQDSTQGVIACTTGHQPAGAEVVVTDAAGTPVLSFSLPHDCVLLILSSPELTRGQTYTLTIGEISGTLEAA